MGGIRAVTLGWWLLFQTHGGAARADGPPLCPDWLTDPDVPTCPSTSLLPETFPPIAHVFSARAIHETRNGEDGLDFAKAYLNSLVSGSGDKVPLLFLPVPQSVFDALQSHISRLPALSAKQKSQWSRRMIHVSISTSDSGNEHITFQQDYVKGFLNPASGKAVLRHMKDRPGAGELGPRLVKIAAQICPGLFEAGPPIGEPPPAEGPLDLPPGFDANLSPNFGGNILGLPGGLCLRGSNQSDSIARQYCKPEDDVSVDVGWLHVGHVDEVFAVVPNTRGAGACNFALVRASPARAMELMREEADRPFFEFPPNLTAAQRKSRMESPSLRDICAWAKDLPPRSSSASAHGAPPPGRSSGVPCALLTNAEALEAITKNGDALAYQQAVEQKMREGEKRILSRIKKRLGCAPRVIRAPSLFRGGPLTQGNLPAEMGKSLFPNPTNVVPLYRRVLSPHPHSATFRRALTRDFHSLGLNQKSGDGEGFIDTFDYGHRGNGNLHCAVQTIRGCRK